MPTRRISLYAVLAVAVLATAGRQRGQPAGRVYYVSLDGDDGNSGDAGQPWRHIEWAATRPFLRGGDTIRVRPGVYRPAIEAAPRRDSPTDDALIRPVASGEPGQPITLMAEPGAAAVLTGRLAAERWEGGGPLYYHDYAVPAMYPFEAPFQVVEDGKLLYRVSSLEAVDRPGRCFVDAAGARIWIRTSDGRPPDAHRLEYGVVTSGFEFRAGVRHWRLSGLALTGFRTSGVVIAGRAGGIELDGLDISYVGSHRPGADPTSGWALTVHDTSGGNFVHGSSFHHTLAEAVHVSQTGAGGDLYENNSVHDAGGPEWLTDASPARLFYGPGMILRGDGVTVRSNRFYGNGYHGLILESDLLGAEGAARPSGNVIEGNTFALNGGNGLHADGKNGLAASSGNVIRFNLFDRNNQARRGSNGDAELRLAGNFDSTVVYNNTFYAEQANGVLVAAGRAAAGAAQGADAIPEGTRLVNNNVVHNAPYRQTWPVRTIEVPADLVLEANNWRRMGPGALANWNGTELGSLEALRSATGLERRGLAVDPLFVSMDRACFWLRAASPLIGRGLSEPGAAPDLGAFPYRPLLAAAPAELRFAALAGGPEPAPQTVQVRSPAGIPLAWTARSGGAPWLRVTPSAGEAPSFVSIEVRPAALQPGVYRATVPLVPGVEGEPPVAVPVVLTVLASPPRRRGL